MAASTKKETGAKAGAATKARKPQVSSVEEKGQASTEAEARALAMKKAKELNVSVKNLTLTEMIRAVQRAEGSFDCFATATVHCDQNDCCWRSVCLTTT